MIHSQAYFNRTPHDKWRICCNCGNNVRVEEKGHINCYCSIDGSYIGYIKSFEGWCRRWRKERKWDASN